jgi:chromosome partitioning protein
VKIADLDVSQGTSFNWQGRRLQAGIEPVVPVERLGTVEQAVRSAGDLDLMILDAPPNSTAATLRIARAADGIPAGDQPIVLGVAGQTPHLTVYLTCSGE